MNFMHQPEEPSTIFNQNLDKKILQKQSPASRWFQPIWKILVKIGIFPK